MGMSSNSKHHVITFSSIINQLLTLVVTHSPHPLHYHFCKQLFYVIVTNKNSFSFFFVFSFLFSRGQKKGVPS